MKRSSKSLNGYKVLYTLNFLLLIFIFTIDSNANEVDLSVGDEVMGSEPIDIDGVLQQRTSEADRLANMRKKLERENENLVRKKIEDIRVEAEKEMTKKLKNLFNGNNQGFVKTKATKTVINSKTSLKENKKSQTFSMVKITPRFGVREIFARSNEVTAKVLVGLEFESNINNSITLGLNMDYSNLDSKVDYYPMYQIEGDFFNVGLFSKYNFLPDSKFRPYVGLGLTYNKGRIKFDNSSLSTIGGSSFINYVNQNNISDNLKYDINGISASLKVGSELMFSKRFGVDFGINYSKSFVNNFSNNDEYYNNYYNYGFSSYGYNSTHNEVLENVGTQLYEAHMLTIDLGVVFKF